MSYHNYLGFNAPDYHEKEDVEAKPMNRRIFVSYIAATGFNNMVIKFSGERITQQTLQEWKWMIEDLLELKMVTILFFKELDTE